MRSTAGNVRGKKKAENFRGRRSLHPMAGELCHGQSCEKWLERRKNECQPALTISGATQNGFNVEPQKHKWNLVNA